MASVEIFSINLRTCQPFPNLYPAFFACDENKTAQGSKAGAVSFKFRRTCKGSYCTVDK